MLSFANIHFVNPGFLLLLGLIPIFAIRYVLHMRSRFVDIRMSNLEAFDNTLSLRAMLMPMLPRFEGTCFCCISRCYGAPPSDHEGKKI